MAIKKTYRVKRSKDFNQIFAAKDSYANKKFVVYRLDNTQSHYRVGLSVSKKIGNAVTRNRVKRLIRHIVRESAPYLQDNDFVVIARKGVEELDYAATRKNLIHILKLSQIYRDGEID